MNGVVKFLSAFGTRPGATRGAVWMTLSAVFYACTYGTVRAVSETIPVLEIVFFRSMMGILFMLPWLARVGVGALRTKRMGLYWVRTGLNYVGMVCLMYGIVHLTLQDVTALMFTSPLFSVLFIALLLKEKVGPARWCALMVGFAGALVIIRPGFIEVSLATVAVLTTASSYGLVNTANKSLSRTEDTSVITFYIFLFMAVVGAVPAITVWVTPTLWELPMILAMGLFSTLATLCVVRALAATDASVVMPFNFLKLPFSVLIGFIWFTEDPDLWTGIGAAIIFSTTVYVARREARLKAAEKT